jgi:hypothetical protein
VARGRKPRPWRFTAVVGVPGATYAMNPNDDEACEAATLCPCPSCTKVLEDLRAEQIEFLAMRRPEGQPLL